MVLKNAYFIPGAQAPTRRSHVCRLQICAASTVQYARICFDCHLDAGVGQRQISPYSHWQIPSCSSRHLIRSSRNLHESVMEASKATRAFSPRLRFARSANTQSLSSPSADLVRMQSNIGKAGSSNIIFGAEVTVNVMSTRGMPSSLRAPASTDTLSCLLITFGLSTFCHLTLSEWSRQAGSAAQRLPYQ